MSIACNWQESAAENDAPTARDHSGGVLVTVATYNELKSLPRLVAEIFASLPAAQVLVVDDNSPDGTGRWCDAAIEREPRLHCLHRAGKLGLGSATIAAMRHAIEHGYEYMINMDGDLSHSPSYLPALLAGMDGDAGHGAVDVMIGSRYVRGGRVEGWPWPRYLMSWGVNQYARRVLRLPTRDCSGAYRCYRTSVLARVDFSQVRGLGYSFQEEILWHLARAGARFGETPIAFVDRRYGESKVDGREALTTIAALLRLGATSLVRR